MRLVHEPAAPPDQGDGRASRRVLATDVEVADSLLSQARGLMFREKIPEDYALVMDLGDSGGWLPFASGPPRRFVHMLFVRFPIDVLWLADGAVVATERLRPWRGFGGARADTIVELPAGGAAGVAVGDYVRLEA
jgi:hypothetical protein